MPSVRQDNYITVQGWMVTELGLKNAELMVYAVIYGFSQDGSSTFGGKLAYLMEWAQASKPTVLAAISSLLSRGLIAKIESAQLNGVRGVEYYALPREDQGSNSEDGGKETLPGVKKFNRGGKETLPGGVKNLTATNNRFYNNKYNYNYNNTPSSADTDGERGEDGGNTDGSGEPPSGAEQKKRTSSKPRMDELTTEFDGIWAAYPRKEGRKRALAAYVAARRAGVSAETIRAGVHAYAERIRADGTEARYVMQGGNWFNGRRWEDKPPSSPQHDGGTNRRGNNRALGYRQQRYSAEQLRAMGVDLGEDVYDQGGGQ